MQEEIRYGYTRVSTILSMIPSKTKDGWEIAFNRLDPEMLANKARIGSEVHNCIDAWAKGEFYPLPEDCKGYFDSFLLWSDFVKLVPIESEMRLYDDYQMLTGKVDMVGQMLDSTTAWRLFDFKCTVSEDEKKWPLQACAYWDLLRYNLYAIDTRCLFVKLDKEGRMPKIFEYNIESHIQTAWIANINLFKWLTKK